MNETDERDVRAHVAEWHAAEDPPSDTAEALRAWHRRMHWKSTDHEHEASGWGGGAVGQVTARERIVPPAAKEPEAPETSVAGRAAGTPPTNQAERDHALEDHVLEMHQDGELPPRPEGTFLVTWHRMQHRRRLSGNDHQHALPKGWLNWDEVGTVFATGEPRKDKPDAKEKPSGDLTH